MPCYLLQVVVMVEYRMSTQHLQDTLTVELKYVAEPLQAIQASGGCIELAYSPAFQHR